MTPLRRFVLGLLGLAGVAVGLGTDGEKENNNLDLFEELKTASLLGKLRDMDAAALPSWQVLGMGTLGGARALGRGHDLGSLEVGKQADLVAVRTDKAKALETFNAGAGGYRDRDLYPFCANVSDGMFTAHPSLRGKPVRDLRDSSGRNFGEDIMRAGSADGTVNEVSYSFPRPGGGDPAPKVTYVTKIGDQVCGVGYYK